MYLSSCVKQQQKDCKKKNIKLSIHWTSDKTESYLTEKKKNELSSILVSVYCLQNLNVMNRGMETQLESSDIPEVQKQS